MKKTPGESPAAEMNGQKKIPRRMTEDCSRSRCQDRKKRSVKPPLHIFRFAHLFLAARFGTIRAEPLKRFISSRKALPTRNRVLDRKVWGPIFFTECK